MCYRLPFVCPESSSQNLPFASIPKKPRVADAQMKLQGSFAPEALSLSGGCDASRPLPCLFPQDESGRMLRQGGGRSGAGAALTWAALVSGFTMVRLTCALPLLPSELDSSIFCKKEGGEHTLRLGESPGPD